MKQIILSLYILFLLTLVAIGVIKSSKIKEPEIKANPTVIKLEPTPTIMIPTKYVSMYNEVNKVRIENKLHPLKPNTMLEKSATDKACDMVKNNYWAHQAPDGQMCWHLFTEAGYKYTIAGENLARDLTEKQVVKAFMNSPPHKANVLGLAYEDLGIGKCGKYIVFHFGRENHGN